MSSSTNSFLLYRKIPIICPGAYFWSKGLFKNFCLGGGGVLIFGGAYTWTNICVLKTLFFVQAKTLFFVQAIFCNFLTFSSHTSLLLLFSLFYF